MKYIPSIRVIKESRLDAVIHTKTKREAIMLVKILGVDKEGLYDENDFIECWNKYKEDTCYRIRNGKVDRMDCVEFYQKINEEIYEFSDLFADGGIATLKPRDESVSFASAPYLDLSLILPTNSRELEEKFNKELAKHFNAFSNDGISAKNGGKNSMKFTFYVTEGTRVDKSCNGTIPTTTTVVSYIDKYGYVMTGIATCDKADYDERQGVLEALANAVCGDNFYKAYAEAIKLNRCEDELSCTCAYCGKVFGTVEEKQEHEAWHVERKKARRERYLLHKRAKEIAFEEAAQKMAKEIIAEDKKK